MSANRSPSPAPERPVIAWLLLRDGHAVPISGLAPDALKAAREATVQIPGVPLKHTTGLNAIVHELGFDGDFGDYQHRHWPRIQMLMEDYGLHEYVNLFEVAVNDLAFGLPGRRRRELSDRVFLGPPPIPRRVFTGHGHDWENWDRHFGQDQVGWLPGDDRFEPTEPETTRRWVYRHRFELPNNHGFMSDHLLDLGSPGTFVASTYFTDQVGADERRVTIERQRKVAGAFRWFIDRRDDGWVGIVPVTPRLALLTGPGGSYDLLWRSLRYVEPPTPEHQRHRFGLNPLDTPSFVQAELDFKLWNYRRRDAWDEQERHEAELAHYAGGGRLGDDYPGEDAVLERLLRSRGIYGEKPRLPKGKLAPAGFTPVARADGGSLLVSGMVTVGEFRRFAEATEYFARRTGQDWSAANDGNSDAAPVGATLRDALAYCTWLEQQLGVGVRLLTIDEHRALRPFASEHYRNLRLQDFPWENYPPRFDLQPAVEWSEPRFIEPGPEVPALPPPNGLSRNQSRKRWIVDTNWPPKAVWRQPLAWTAYTGIDFIDAWDAYEWCADGRIAGRYWEGVIGIDSWGEYKNAKVGFRLVIEQEAKDE